MIWPVQEAVANRHGLPMETLLASCRQHKASDQMVMFVRAVCAAGLRLDPEDSHTNLLTMLEEAGVPCR